MVITFNSKIEDGVLHFVLEGNLIGEDIGSSIIEKANEAVAQGVFYCIVDINKVKYINSSGIGVLITLLTKFRNKEGEVIIVNPSEHVKKLLIITKLSAIFKMTDSLEEAIQEIKS